ncbi:MAG: type I restriction enzyme HsdR N-terminal domain-containing protein [Paludibacter sp.]|nr:type I restriction enzyme HsdR N-terminal domain-containing protein [Paludibacter sp.]
MQILNLPRYNFAVKKVNSKLQIFDSQRKKYVTLTPEEWVRQHFVRFLIEEKHFPSSRLAVEYTLKIKDMERRCDIVVFAKNGKPQIIIEIKAPQIILNQAVFDQIAIYNSQLNVDYYIISNGLEHYCCRVDRENSRYEFLPEIPDYQFFQ